MKRCLALLLNLSKIAPLVALALLACLHTQAQKDSAKIRRVLDSSFIKSYYHLLDINLQFGSQYMEYRTYYNDTFF